MPAAYREQAAGAGLRRWVECVWQVETDHPVAYPVRPDGCLDLLYSREDGLRVVGAMTAQRWFDLPAGGCTVGIRLRPGMAGSLLPEPGRLTNLVAPADALLDAATGELERRLADAEAAADRLAILLGGLREPAPPSGVQRAIETIVEARGTVDLEWVARQANLSERQFRRRCLEESGLAPKQLCRILRFRHACELAARSARPEWAALAAEAGYFDQAHLIRDFHEFADATPMSVFSNPADRLSL